MLSAEGLLCQHYQFALVRDASKKIADDPGSPSLALLSGLAFRYSPVEHSSEQGNVLGVHYTCVLCIPAKRHGALTSNELFKEPSCHAEREFLIGRSQLVFVLHVCWIRTAEQSHKRQGLIFAAERLRLLARSPRVFLRLSL